MSLRQKFLNILLASLLAVGLAGEAYARAGGGGSFGSRGGRTFSAPSMTQTAPRGATPFERSMTSPNQGIFRPGMGSGMAAGARPGFFSGGFGRGLLGGFLGAGLFGLLFGHGLFGGLGSGMSFLGLLIQIGLLFLLFKFVMGFLRNRQQPAFQGAAYQGGPQQGGSMPGGLFGFGGMGRGAGNASQPLPIQTADYTAFEQKLGAIEAAFSNEDLNGLRSLTTPEMASYFAEEIAANASKGLVNKISDVKLLQGDVAESWREASGEYATVAMRFSLVDRMIERATGRIISGGAPEQATEIWTFFRPQGATPADWKLSAIQQQA